jgi:hypothetical protein
MADTGKRESSADVREDYPDGRVGITADGIRNVLMLVCLALIGVPVWALCVIYCAIAIALLAVLDVFKWIVAKW